MWRLSQRSPRPCTKESEPGHCLPEVGSELQRATRRVTEGLSLAGRGGGFSVCQDGGFDLKPRSGPKA